MPSVDKCPKCEQFARDHALHEQALRVASDIIKDANARLALADELASAVEAEREAYKVRMTAGALEYGAAYDDHVAKINAMSAALAAYKKGASHA